MKLINSVRHESENKKIYTVFDADVSATELHDYLLDFKGHVVDIIVDGHKQEKENAENYNSKSCCGG